MLEQKGPIGIGAWLTSENETAAELELERLMEATAPIIRRVVQGRFFTSRNVGPEDIEDVCSDATAALLVRLRLAREGTGPIEHLTSYVAALASNATDKFFAARAPRRAQLRSRIRYLLSTDPAFQFLQGDAGVWVCALSGTGSAPPASPLAVERVRARLASHRLPPRLGVLLREILRAAGAPLDLADLTSLVAEATGVTDTVAPLHEVAEPRADAPVALRVELKDWLGALWLELRELPFRQRAALLLNMGSAAGSGEGATMCLLVDMGIVGFSTLAAILEMGENELAQLWNRVPLSDLEIAERFGISRQQSINLRSAARERLTRRLANMRAKSDTRIVRRES